MNRETGKSKGFGFVSFEARRRRLSARLLRNTLLPTEADEVLCISGASVAGCGCRARRRSGWWSWPSRA
jgi:hypothetical protein